MLPVSNTVPLDLIICIEELILPSLADGFCFLLSWIVWDSHKHHQGLALLAHLKDTLRIAGIYLGEVDLWCWSFMFHQVIRIFLFVFLSNDITNKGKIIIYVWGIFWSSLGHSPLRKKIVIVLDILYATDKKVIKSRP